MCTYEINSNSMFQNLKLISYLSIAWLLRIVGWTIFELFFFFGTRYSYAGVCNNYFFHDGRHRSMPKGYSLFVFPFLINILQFLDKTKYLYEGQWNVLLNHLHIPYFKMQNLIQTLKNLLKTKGNRSIIAKLAQII